MKIEEIIAKYKLQENPSFDDLLTELHGADEFTDRDAEIASLKEENKSLVKGVEACLWAEFVPTMKKGGYCTYPRLGAYCETAWSPKENKNYGRFLQKLPSYYAILEGYGIDTATLSQANPGLIRKTGNLIWWERRKLCWQGLHNLIDNANVKRKYASKEK